MSRFAQRLEQTARCALGPCGAIGFLLALALVGCATTAPVCPPCHPVVIHDPVPVPCPAPPDILPADLWLPLLNIETDPLDVIEQARIHDAGERARVIREQELALKVYRAAPEGKSQ